MRRLATAALLAPLAWLVCKQAPLGAAVGMMLVFIGLAAWECATLFEGRGAKPFRGLAVLGALAIGWSFSGIPPIFDAEAVLAAGLAGVFIVAIARRREPGEMFDAAVSTLFTMLLLGIGLGHAIRLRAIPGEAGGDLLLLLLVCCFFGDTGAYYVGSAIGRRPLAPRVSPKKSWEGVAGGLAASIGGALLAHGWWYRKLPLTHAVLLGAALAVLGIAGDLAESVAKRAAGVKDSSGILPGHGGILDRIDSLLLAAPFLYYYHRVFLQG